jgi:hemerythrin-like domain-containing protein/quercetin dioxygenase-like cupin family protein
MQETQSQVTHNKVTACASLIQEHRQMERLLDELGQALTGLSPAHHLNDLKTLMGKIEAEINTHFTCEEQALFPAVSPYHPMVLMEVEHEELITLRDNILDLLKAENPTQDGLTQLQEMGERFIQEMLDHIGREDNGIFPVCERALSDEEKETVITGMEAIRQKAKDIPTPSITRPKRTFRVYQAELSSQPKRDIMAHRLFEDTTIETKHLTLQAGKSLAAHWTPKKTILICLQGEGAFHANDQTESLIPGTLIVMSPQLRHAISAKTRCDLLLLLQKDRREDI